MSTPQTFSLEPSSLPSFKDKTVLITGASSGLGLCTASLLHDHGANIVSLDLQPARPRPDLDIDIDIPALTSSPRYLHIPTDVTSWRAQREAFEKGLAKFRRLDAVFVNAGIAEYKEQFFNQDLDEQDHKLLKPDTRTLTIDLDAATYTVRLAIWALRKNNQHGDANGQRRGSGSIILTASLAGYLASAGAANYSAAKHGIVGLMRALKNDTVKLGIAISVVAPGMTITPILTQERSQLQQGGGNGVNEWIRQMKKNGVPFNRPQTIALAVGWLMGLGTEANGKGLLVQNDRVTDVEEGIARSRKMWMGEEQLDLFKGGRDAGLHPNKL